MNTKYISKSTNIIVLLTSMVLISLSFFLTGCEEEDGLVSNPYFSIEGDPTGISTSTAKLEQKYTVRSNCSWQVVAQDSAATWATAFPKEGIDDGIFKLTVIEITTTFARNTYYSFFAIVEDLRVLFSIAVV
ncbi:MAG: hypothetical protein ACK5LR_06920, partial [Mangrovibacterium sp.]